MFINKSFASHYSGSCMGMHSKTCTSKQNILFINGFHHHVTPCKCLFQHYLESLGDSSVMIQPKESWWNFHHFDSEMNIFGFLPTEKQATDYYS